MFKVGDKVRIIGNDSDNLHHYMQLGEEAVIGEIRKSGSLHLHNKKFQYGQLVRPQDVELVVTATKKEAKPTNLKSADDVIISGVTFEQAIKDDILLMAHLYHKGLSFRDVAKLTNVHERTVRRRFKRYGIPSRAPKGVK